MEKHYKKSPKTKLIKLTWIIVIIAIVLSLVLLLCTQKIKEITNIKKDINIEKKIELQNKEYTEEELIEKKTIEERDKILSSDNAQITDIIKAGKTVKKIIIIVDDGGINSEYAKSVAQIRMPLTWAIIPYEKNSRLFAEIADENNIPYLVHMPMQSIYDKEKSKYVIGIKMNSQEIKDKISGSFEILPGAIGLNNHRGSLATSHEETMQPVMEEIKSRGLIFVDSNTIKESIAYDKAIENGVVAYKNNGFLDVVADKGTIKSTFYKILKHSRRSTLVLICHFRPETIKFLKELEKEYKNINAEFVTLKTE
ncbi:MAG: divergent polysaccharide deacetylase family protein [Synergistaceae bacterium]